MELADYLNKFDDENGQLNIVGPFYDGVYLDQEPVIFVDGGAKSRENHIGFAIGDGDSTTKRLDQYLPEEKDMSDLGFSLAQIPRQFNLVHLLGFLGGRKDHELANLGEAFALAKRHGQPLRIFFDYDLVVYSAGDWSFARDGEFSLFTLEANIVSLSGDCKYSLNQQTLLPLSSHGLSNVGHGSIKMNCTAPIMIYRSNEEVSV